jgi:hypothetical protein
MYIWLNINTQIIHTIDVSTLTTVTLTPHASSVKANQLQRSLRKVQQEVLPVSYTHLTLPTT